MDDASNSSTEQRPISEEVAPCTSGLGQPHPQQPERHRVGGVALAVCVASLILFGCVTDGGASDAATPVPPGGGSTTSTSTINAAAVADVNELPVPAWVTQLVDLPPGRVARVDDTSIWYVARGSFDDVVALLVEQLGAPAPLDSTHDTVTRWSWQLDRGSVMAVATQSLRWNPRAPIIGVSRNSGVSTTSGR